MDASQVDEEDARSTDSHDHGAHLAGKEVMAVTLLKIDHFAARLAAIQAQVATRSLDAQSRHAPTQAPSATAPLYGSPLSISSVSPRKLSRNGGAADTMETRRLPLLQQLERNDALPADNPLSFAHVQQRATRQQQFMNDAEQVAHAEEQAAVAIQEADRLAEDVRIGMLMYAQNERSWTFDERARRYQLLLEAKNKADAARKEADAERSVARQLRAKLTDPYGSHRRLRVSPSSPLSALPKSPSAPSTSTTGTAQVASVAHSRDDYALVWLLAAPSPNITFTPREQTVQMMLNQDKELSMHVVYYAALSVLNDSEGDLEALALLPDHPPRDGWLCSSTHGVAPAPSIVSTKASVETWIVAGAGALHVNGKYIASGQHNGLAKFKSSTGVELFRKWLPKASSVTMGLYDAPTSKGAASLAHDDNHNEDNEDAAAKTNQEQHSEAVVLPIVLQQMANDVLNFDAMRRIGSWLGANEVNDKLRRQREKLEFQLDTPSPGDHVNVQDVQKRAALPNALAPSRVEAVPELCREWVLFLHCSRRPRPRDDPAAPPAVAGLGCLKRHYYVSHEEQARMSTWAQAEEAWLEKRVLHAIIQREEQLARLQNLATKCMKRFQQDLKAETTKTARKLLTELNCMRFLTVKVLEAIDTWRCHARKTGFVRYEPSLEAAIQPDANDQQDLEPPLLGWSASITVTTGKQLYKGSKAFVSKLKRFRRAEDATGKLEQRIVYLGYFALRVDAERAYDDYAVAEARRRNTTLQHMPRRRGVFRSCGKHFAIESEGMGPAFCIECKTKQLSATLSDDEWMPPFLYTPGHNYILQLATDLDFLDKLPPLQALLNDGYGFGQRFPLLGNVFLLPRTPIQDPALAFFTVLGTTQAPRLGSRNNQDDAHEIDAETLDRDRILRVQRLFLQEMQMYHPELFEQDATTTPQTRQAQLRTTMAAKVAVKPRVVEAMYWDRCTALKIAQERPPVAFRQDQVWCRPDAGEWASLVVRGCHQLHFLFETRLAASGKEMQLKRRKLLQTMRQVLRLPLYEVHDRTVLTMLVSEAQLMKGDVVLLELKNLVRFLERYDAWCMSSRIVQRWYRGVYGRKRARTRRRALRLVARTRTQHLACVATFAACYYRDNIATVAIHNAVHKLAMPVHTYAIKLEDEYAIVSLHVRQAEQDWREARPRSERELGWRVQQSNCCASCARRFRVQSFYSASTRKFQVIAGPCTCGVNGGHTKSRPRQEQWLLRAYSPTNNRVYRLCIANSLLQQLARALGLGNLVDCSSPDSRKVWNPVEEMRIKHQRAITTARLTEFCSRQAALALEMVLNWRMLSAEATQHRKIVVLRLEQATEALETRRREYATSIVLAKKAVDFTSKKFHEAQAWDALENSNDWKLLVDKRAAEKNVAAAELEQERCRFDAFQAHFNEQFLRARTSQEHAQFEHTWVPVQKQWTAQLEHAAADENRATARVETLMQSLARHLVTLRDTFLAPTRRQLVIRSAAWRQPPLYVAMPGLAHGRNTLVRRGLLLTNHALDRSNARSHLMIVDVSVWPSGDIGRDPRTERDVWIQAYDAKTSYVHTVFLEWELVQMLLARRGRKLKALGARAHQHTIATRLLAMTMLDRYTGEFTLEKLRFYHILRVLAPQVLSSKWFRDLERGRKSGRGDLVLRQALCLHGHLAVVAVYENWGDLTLCVYESATARDLRLTLPLDRVLALLSTRPALLHLWVHCVKSNTYDPTVLTAILQSVRFTDTGDGLLTTSDVVAEPRTRTFRRSLRIQDRRVLVFVSADQSGDLRIKAFDLRQSHTYTLFIERAHLRRLLRRSRDASAVANSSIPGIVPESLLGRRHWGGLCEWLCQRLVFQSLGEHPDALVAAHSPVSSGLAVRHSYDVLNEWIGHAPRNPLQPVPKDVIDRASAHIDAQAFSCVLFDQLAVVAEPKLPFDHGKHWLLSAPCKVPALAATLPSPFMVDWFVRGHTLHARVRQELLHEIITRREGEEREAMANEEKQHAWVLLQRAAAACEAELAHWKTKLQRMHTAVIQHRARWEQVFRQAMPVAQARASQLRLSHAVAAANASDSDHDDNSIINPTTDMDEDDFIVFPVDPLDVDEKLAPILRTALPDFRPLLSAFVPEHTEFFHALDAQFGFLAFPPLFLPLLDACTRHLEGAVEPSVRHYRAISRESAGWYDITALKLATYVLEHVRQSFVPSPLARPPTAAISDRPQATPAGAVQQSPETASAPLSSPRFTWSTFMMPAATLAEIEEVFIPGVEVFAAQHPRWQWSPATMEAIAAVFEMAPAAVPSCIVVRRVEQGILLFQALSQDVSSSRESWNPRASALTSELVRGPAIYVHRNYIDDSMTTTVPLHQACSVFEEVVSAKQRRTTTTVRRASTKRQKQLLPWKIEAMERMQAGRTARKLAQEFAVALTTLERARDAVSLGTISMDHRQLEVMVGHAPWRQLCERSMENLASILRLTSRQDSGGLAIELKHDTQLLHMVDDVAVAASDVTPKGFKLDHLQVEVDCVWQPRRLIFSCREVRTQQVYFVDCSYHQLRAETGSALCLWPDSSTSLTVVDWRELARKAAARIVVCKHNGRLELEIGPKQAVAVDADTGLESIATDVASELERSSESVLDAPLHTTGAISRRWREQRQDVLRRCAWHRFQKHQTAILVRQTIALAKQQVLAVERQRLGLEWMQMIREDWRSQQYRGVLVLDNKQLKKLQAAFTTGTRRAKMKHEDAAHTPEHSSPMPLLVEQQLIEIAKEMGLHAPTSGEMQAHLAQMRSMRWWKEAQSPSSVVNDQDNPMPLIDVIEWWRLHVASQSLRHRHIK